MRRFRFAPPSSELTVGQRFRNKLIMVCQRLAEFLFDTASIMPSFGGGIDGQLVLSFNPPRLTRLSTNAACQLEKTENSRSEEHTSELQSLTNLVCRLLLEKK